VSQLNISKVAVGCASLDALRLRQAMRLVDGIVSIVTRYRPKRADELVGGSIYWIVKHRIAARQTIIGFATSEEDGRTIIRLDRDLIPVKPRPKRAHQGWRYLVPADMPDDYNEDDGGLSALPVPLSIRLSSLALI
jgi:hypothetical protein